MGTGYPQPTEGDWGSTVSEKRFYCFLSASERFLLQHVRISTQSHLFSWTLRVTFQHFPGPRPDCGAFQVLENFTF